MGDMYYTPTIEEFHVGFECEYVEEEHFGEKIWSEFDIDSSMAMEQFVYDYHHSDKSLKELFRVKYLDREDIERLGFEKVGSECYRGSKFEIHKYEDGLDVMILSLDQDVLFNGIIRNKSELERVLKMIDVEI
jgi:hypothetical protein